MYMLNERPELKSEKGFRGLVGLLGEWKWPDVNNPYKNFLKITTFLFVFLKNYSYLLDYQCDSFACEKSLVCLVPFKYSKYS